MVQVLAQCASLQRARSHAPTRAGSSRRSTEGALLAGAKPVDPQDDSKPRIDEIRSSPSIVHGDAAHDHEGRFPAEGAPERVLDLRESGGERPDAAAHACRGGHAASASASPLRPAPGTTAIAMTIHPRPLPAWSG